MLDISIRNNTMTPLDWVKVEWDGPYLPGGILSPGISSTAVGVEAPKSDFVTLTFVEHASRTPHALRLDVTRLKRLRSGRYDVTLAVTSLETAELTIDEHTK